MEKIYEVEFMEYTNGMNDTVKMTEGNYLRLNDGHSPFLIRESDIEKYSKYGKGFRSLKFVGYME